MACQFPLLLSRLCGTKLGHEHAWSGSSNAYPQACFAGAQARGRQLGISHMQFLKCIVETDTLIVFESPNGAYIVSSSDNAIHPEPSITGAAALTMLSIR